MTKRTKRGRPAKSEIQEMMERITRAEELASSHQRQADKNYTRALELVAEVNKLHDEAATAKRTIETLQKIDKVQQEENRAQRDIIAGLRLLLKAGFTL